MIRFQYSEAYRQGELLFFRVKPQTLQWWSGAKKVPVPSGIIRVGEKEGHEHKLGGAYQLDMFPGTTTTLTGEADQPAEGVIKVGKKGARVTHPEHKTLELPPGEYAVKTQKEATGRNTHASVRD
jgi:hypothetical protein